MMSPAYRIGQFVRRRHRAFAHEKSGFGDVNEIVALLPPDADGAPRYRIQAGFARADVREGELALVKQRHATA